MLETQHLADYSSNIVDFLTCGQCQREFPLQHITTFIQHKRKNCEQYLETDGDLYARQLNCFSCPQIFCTAWALLKHIEFKHQLKLFLEKTPSLSFSLSHHHPHDTDETVSQHQSKFTTQEIVDNSNTTSTNQKINNENVLEEEASINNDQLDRNPHCEGIVRGSIECIETINVVNNINSSQTLIDDIVDEESSIDSNIRNKSLLVNAQTNNEVTNTEIDTSSSVTDGQNISSSYPLIMAPVDEHSYSETFTRQDDKQLPIFPKIKDKPSNLAINFPEDDPQTEQTNNSDVEDIHCCDSLECGVSVVPGTHETMKKCCASIVPKKRKRHMETKHLSYTFSKALRRRSFAQRCKMNRLTNKSESRGTIYIDVGTVACSATTAGDSVTSQTVIGVKEDHNIITQQPLVGASESKSNLIQDSPVNNINNKGAVMNKGSLILKPGSVFTIPISSSFILPHYKTAMFTQPVTAKTQESSLPSDTTVATTCVPQQTVPTTSTNNIPVVLKNAANQSVAAAHSLSTDFVSNTHNENSSNPLNDETEDTSDETGVNLYIDQANDVTECSDSPGNKGKKRRYPTSRPFKCDQCEHCFNQRIHLKKHQSKHTGIKPYKCQQCDYSTVERSHLKVHIRIHTGEKPFKCTYCEYATAQNSTLKIHLKRHHGGKMLECRSCNKKFTQKETLQKHETIDHQASK